MIRTTEYGEVTRFDLARTIAGKGRYWTAAYQVDGLLVDTGCAHSAHDLHRALNDTSLDLILNTHSHEDHIGANAVLQRERDGLRVLTHPSGIPVLADPRAKQPLHPYRRIYWGYPEPSIGGPVADGGEIETARYKFQVIYTPGHSPDHLCLYEPSMGWMFTGDLFVGGKERALRVEKLAMDTNAYRRSLIATVAVGGWVYLHNVVETYLLAASPGVKRLEGSGFKVTTPKKSARRAALRSLFFPGLGQRYAGHGGRGFLFRAGVFVLALFTIDAKLRYDLAVSDRNVAVLEYNNATSVPEREALLPEVLIQTVSVEERKDSVVAFAVATGLVWLANIFEAWGSGGGDEVHTDRFETSTTYRNSTVWQEVKFNF